MKQKQPERDLKLQLVGKSRQIRTLKWIGREWRKFINHRIEVELTEFLELAEEEKRQRER